MRVAIVTGANCGVGFHTSLALAAQHNFRVILACRSVSRGEAAVARIKSEAPHAKAETMEVDLSEYTSVVSFADRVRREIGAVHVLVLNAGVGGMGSVPTPTADASADWCYRVNFGAHFLLTVLLKDVLAAGAPARVVCLSSVMHRFGDPSDWLAPLTTFSPTRKTYATSKLAMAVFAAEITRRWGAEANPIRGLAVNPGAVNSNIWYRGQLRESVEACVVKPVFTTLFLTSKQGAATSVAAASDPDLQSAPPGTYLCPYRTPSRMPMPFELHGPYAGARRCTPHPAVDSPAAGRALWETSSGALAQWIP